MTDARTGAVVVVGAASTLGTEVARRLAARYRGVLLVDREAAPLVTLADELSAGSGVVGWAAGDIGDETFARQSIERVTAEHGGVGALVNVLARPRAGGLLAESPPPWNETLNQHIRSLYAFSRPAVEAMRASGTPGRIVTVSSRAWLGEDGEPVFAAAASAVTGFTRSLSLEVGRFGVTVNALACAYIDTPEWRAGQPDQAERTTRATAVRRAGRPEEVSAVVDFLTSADAAFITGQVIAVCGGSSIGKATF